MADAVRAVVTAVPPSDHGRGLRQWRKTPTPRQDALPLSSVMPMNKPRLVSGASRNFRRLRFSDLGWGVIAAGAFFGREGQARERSAARRA